MEVVCSGCGNYYPFDPSTWPWFLILGGVVGYMAVFFIASMRQSTLVWSRLSSKVARWLVLHCYCWFVIDFDIFQCCIPPSSFFLLSFLPSFLPLSFKSLFKVSWLYHLCVPPSCLVFTKPTCASSEHPNNVRTCKIKQDRDSNERLSVIRARLCHKE